MATAERAAALAQPGTSSCGDEATHGAAIKGAFR
jgi:hypothetical protein